MCGGKYIAEGDARVVEINGRRDSEGLLGATIRKPDYDLFEAHGQNRSNKTEKRPENKIFIQ